MKFRSSSRYPLIRAILAAVLLVFCLAFQMWIVATAAIAIMIYSGFQVVSARRKSTLR